MNIFLHNLAASSPHFLLVFVGWAVMKAGLFDAKVSQCVSKFVFRLLMPVLLFNMLAGLADMPPMDWKVLIAFFGSCAFTFTVGRIIAKKVFGLGTNGQVIIGMGGIFGNNVQLGIPIVQASLGAEAFPTISLLIIFNVLIFWTGATACVEFGKAEGRLDIRKTLRAMTGVLKNPIVIGILCGSFWGLGGWKLPAVAQETVSLIASATTPCALLAVGMGLAQYSFTQALPKSSIITLMKLAVQPCLVYLLCRLLGIGDIQTAATVVLSCLPCAINLFIMATEFDAEQGPASSAIFVSTFFSAFTVPLVLTFLGVGS